MIGIDEVGRGAWAGPLLVVAARDRGPLPEGLKDSKVLTKHRREMLQQSIEAACDLGEGWVSPQEIDQLGLTEAMRLAVQRALSDIDAAIDEQIIMDGHINYCAPSFQNVQAVVDADATYPIVSAASIYAKVVRDAAMVELGKQFPAYGFDRHVGYGTRQHRDALVEYGVCLIHRTSYKPIRGLVTKQTQKTNEQSEV